MIQLPDIFSIVSQNAACRALLKDGKKEFRFYSFGMAPQGVAYPYAVWQIISGTPDNNLTSGDYDAEEIQIQVDVYSSHSQGSIVARDVANKIMTAIKPVAYTTSFRAEERDFETMNYRSSFDSSWINAVQN